MRPIPFRSIATFILPLAAAACLGCSNRPEVLAPQLGPSDEAARLGPDGDGAFTQSDAAGFIPLALGNRWQYGGHIVEESSFDDGRYFVSERDYHQDNELICVETVGDRPYIVERQSQYLGPGVGFVQFVRFRENTTGLYEADIATSQPPPCFEFEPDNRTRPAVDEGRVRLDSAARQGAYDRARAGILARLERLRRAAGLGIPAPGEDLKRLAYPLYIGSQWQIRSDPLFTARVVARESVSLPAGRMAGFKVQILSEPAEDPPTRREPALLGPRDRVYFWVGRNGFLLYTFDLVGTIIDAEANPIGEIAVSERRELLDYAIERPLPWATATAASPGYSLTTR